MPSCAKILYFPLKLLFWINSHRTADVDACTPEALTNVILSAMDFKIPFLWSTNTGFMDNASKHDCQNSITGLEMIRSPVDVLFEVSYAYPYNMPSEIERQTEMV